MEYVVYISTVNILTVTLICVCTFRYSSASCTTLYSSGTIQSPNYPANYPNNADVCWILRADSDRRIHLRFPNFNTERNTDYVYTYDGEAADDNKLIDRFSNSFLGIPMARSQGTSMYVRFTSNRRTRSGGFQGTFTSVDLVACTILTTVGSFHTTNYPNEYPSDADECWLIQAHPSQVINIQTEDICSETNCDKMVLYDGSTVTSAVLDVLSGCSSSRYIALTYTSSSSEVLVTFDSDDNAVDDGTKLSFTFDPVVVASDDSTMRNCIDTGIGGRKYITALSNVQQTNGHIDVGFPASSKIRCISECVYDSACVAVNVRQTHTLHCQLLNTIDTTQHTVHTQWNVLVPAC